MLALSIGVSLVFVAIFFWSDKGLAELRRLDRRAEAIRQDTAMLAAENDRLRAEIAKTPNDRLRLERLAREELGLARPGEIVLVLPPNPSRLPADRNEPPRTWEIREREEIAKASNPKK
jgi:cell division protein FtsB